MGETRVLLLRHAETAAPDRFHGAESDIGLSERGRRQSVRAAEVLAALRPEALYCSAMRRAVETARPIGEACALTPRVVADLHERRMGPLSGQLREAGLAAYEEAKHAWQRGELDWTHEGGESYAAIRRRLVPAWRGIVDAHPGRTIAVVAHGVVIRVLLTTILEGYGPHDFSRIGIDNVALNDLRLADGRWRAVSLNARVAEETAEPPAEGGRAPAW